MKKVTGSLFKEMVISGANNLHNHHPEIDALNVFPVPDGDTGTNMSLTFMNGANEIKDLDSTSIYVVAKALSKGLLMGARGNSGVILSQIFRGFALSLEDQQEADALMIAQAFANGAKVAYKAVMRPVEGTILTVIREASEALESYVQEDMDIEELFSYFIKEMDASLQRTPDLLPVLKEVGVVDSGATGLLTVLQGFLACLQGKAIAYEKIESAPTATENFLETKPQSQEFGYCTEFILRLEGALVDKFNENQLKNELERLPGNSIVVVQDDDIVKVHVHTLKPGNALNIGQRFGEFMKLKIENMQEQHNTIIDQEHMKDTKKPRKKVAMISVCAGDGLKEAFLELNCDSVISGGQTMNPSTEDLVRSIKEANADTVIILPNNSNIIMAAQQTATILENTTKVIVIPSKTIPQGLAACIMFQPDQDIDHMVADMKEAIRSVKTGQVTFAIKDTTFEGVSIKANEYMAICEKDIISSHKKKLDALKDTLQNLITANDELVTLIVGEDVNDQEIQEMESYITDNFQVELEVIHGKQPVYSFIVGVE